MKVYAYLAMEYCILNVWSQCQTIFRRTWPI